MQQNASTKDNLSRLRLECPSFCVHDFSCPKQVANIGKSEPQDIADVQPQLSSAKYYMSHSFLTLVLTPFLRDHNVSLRATDVEEDLTQILRFCIFHRCEPYSQGKCLREGSYLQVSGRQTHDH